METLALAAAGLAALAFAWFRLRRYLHIFQQEEYDGPRFLNWLFSASAFDKRLSAALLLITIFAWIGDNAWPVTALILFAVALAGTIMREPNPEKAAKKKLVITNRAQRILYVAFCLTGLLALAIFVTRTTGLMPTEWALIGFIVFVQVLPFSLVLANILLSPVEKGIQDGFRTAAENRLRAVGPKVVGITGSFGKTSVKHILGHILQMTTNTLYTPGSVNTVMGISRIINERLQDNCRYFLVEMGAYGIGSIKRLCHFTPPDRGILTSIGAAHYERFKDLDTVARAKFELAEAVRERNGRMIVHESALEQPYARTFVDNDRSHFLIVGESEQADVRVTDVAQKDDGLHVGIVTGEQTYQLFAPLYGLHHAHNMALAFAFAIDIGQKPERVIQAMRSTPQITHRLERKQHASGAIYLDDAYNSNPQGFSNALSLLDQLGQSRGRRILVTPGMAELGEKHDEAHAEIGRLAARKTDVTLLVKPERIPSFVRAFTAAGTDSELLKFDQFSEAQAWLNQNLASDDVVLIENDLPDLYERDFVT
jgi:UDP-N-acetylmuramoyl-tripeptide--D-alanyl-D-alanine ligase